MSGRSSSKVHRRKKEHSARNRDPHAGGYLSWSFQHTRSDRWKCQKNGLPRFEDIRALFPVQSAARLSWRRRDGRLRLLVASAMNLNLRSRGLTGDGTRRAKRLSPARANWLSAKKLRKPGRERRNSHQV